MVQEVGLWEVTGTRGSYWCMAPCGLGGFQDEEERPEVGHTMGHLPPCGREALARCHHAFGLPGLLNYKKYFQKINYPIPGKLS